MKDWLPLVGVVIAQIVILILFWLKQRSDDKRRWHEKRLDAYRALSRAGSEASQVFASAEEVEDLDDRRFVTAMNEADACILDVALLSTTEVRDKAEALRTLLEMCVVLDVTSGAFPRAGALLTARFEFESSVRQELGIEARRRFVVEADSKAELAWHAFQIVMVFGRGRLGGTVADRLEPRVLPHKDSVQLTAVNSIEQFTRGVIQAPIVIELGLGYGDNHLTGDIEKLQSSQVPHPYLIHFSHVPSRKHDLIETKVESVAPPLQIAYVRHAIGADEVRIKHRTDPKIGLPTPRTAHS